MVQSSKFLALLITLVSMGPATPFNLAARPIVTRQSTQLHSASSEGSVASSRRHALSAIGVSLAVFPLKAFAAGTAPKLVEVTSFLKESREEISAIPKLLQVLCDTQELLKYSKPDSHTRYDSMHK